MAQVQINMEGNEASGRLRCHEKMEKLIEDSQHFPNPDPPSEPLTLLRKESFGEKNSVIFELQNVVRNGDVDEFVAALERVCLGERITLSTIFDRVAPSGNSLLHEAAYFGKEEIAKLIAHYFPQLLTKTNINGDTPLHVAAQSKHSSVIRVILEQSNADAQRSSSRAIFITRITNKCGNTALHEAVKSKHVEGIETLFGADTCVAHCLNKSNKSPLYLAVQTSDKQIVNILLEAPFPEDEPIPKFHGISPLHAAIYVKNEDLLNKIVEERSDLMFLRDEDEGTPLHYAAATGYVEGVRVLLMKSPHAALEYNTKSHLPVHLAAKWGHIEVLKEFLRQEWDGTRVLLNNKGQNILHVAAESGQCKAVEYILKDRNYKHHAINKQDINGNTPLHLAAASRNLNPFLVCSLKRVKGIDLNIINNEGLTAGDVALLKMPMTVEQAISNWILKLAGAKKSDKGRIMLLEGKCDRLQALKDRIQDKMNILMLVATLIVTVTFAAGFTIPGGVNSSDDENPGMPVLGDEAFFKVFVFFDTLALYCSTLGSFVILGAMIGKFDYLRAYAIALFLVGLALLLMTLAFLASMSLIVSKIRWLALFTIFLGTYSIYVMWILSVLSKKKNESVGD